MISSACQPCWSTGGLQDFEDKSLYPPLSLALPSDPYSVLLQRHTDLLPCQLGKLDGCQWYLSEVFLCSPVSLLCYFHLITSQGKVPRSVYLLPASFELHANSTQQVLGNCTSHRGLLGVPGAGNWLLPKALFRHTLASPQRCVAQPGPPMPTEPDVCRTVASVCTELSGIFA